jgi:ice-binding like protein
MKVHRHGSTWSSSSPKIARAATLVSIGVLTTFASACGSRDVSSPNSLANIVVSPNPQTLAPGATAQLTAVGTDGAGTVMSITPTWSIVNSGGTVDASSGLFTAGGTTGTFSGTAKASSGGKSGVATIIVAADAVAPIANLRTAAVNGIMAGTAVTCVTGGTINANVSVSPGNTITGFGPCVITGVRHLGDAVALQAQNDLTTAYNTLAGLPCDAAIVADLGGTTLLPGVYCTGSSIGVTGTVTLDGNGNPNSTFVFKAGTDLTTAGNVVLINGAQAKNVWWKVGSSATLGTASQWQGNIVALTSITLVDNANLVGRALARNGAVSLGSVNTITLP